MFPISETNIEADADDSVPLFEAERWIGSDLVINPIRCAAHTLQLAIEDAFKTSMLAGTIANARGVCIKLRTPNVALILKEAKLKKPILDCSTRCVADVTPRLDKNELSYTNFSTK